MYKFILAVGITAAMGVVAITNFGSTTEVIQGERVIEEVTPDWASDEEAVKAAQDVIRRKELEVEEARLVGEITSKQDELDEVRKELGTY